MHGNNQNYVSSRGTGIAKICVWLRAMVKPRDLIAMLRRTVLKYVKLRKVNERLSKTNGYPRQRYDIFVAQSEAELALRTLKKWGRTHGARVSRHRSYRQRDIVRRLARQVPATTQVEARVDNNNGKTTQNHSSDAVRNIRITSYNVRGFEGKKSELRCLVQEGKQDCVMIQETLCGPSDAVPHLRNFRAMVKPRTDGTDGERGVAIFVRDTIPAMETTLDSPHVTALKVLVGDSWVLMGSVYLPSRRGPSRTLACTKLGKGLQRLFRKDRDTRVILGGDFNCSRDKLEKLIRKWRVPLMVMRGTGSDVSFPGAMSSLDHFVVSQNVAAQLAPTRVNRTWDLSDHWPVQTTMFVRKTEDGFELPKRRIIRLNLDRLRAAASDIVCDNRFSALTGLPDSDLGASEEEGEVMGSRQAQIAHLDRDVEKFISTSKDIVMEKELEEKPRKKAGFYSDFSNATHRMIRIRRDLSKKIRVMTMVGQVPRDLAQEHAEVSRRVKELKRDDATKAWERVIRTGVDLVETSDFRAFWRWLKRIIGGSTQTATSTPIRNEQGELVVDPRGILDVWATHYQKLFADTTGFSKDEGHWANMELTEQPTLEGLNGPISWKELREVLKSLKSGKAAGSSGIPPEWFKLGLLSSDGKKAGDDLPKASSEFAMALLSLVRRMFDLGYVPLALRGALVVSIPKKGDDLTSVDNYRGISLIEILLKVVTSIVTRRVSRAVEGAGLLVEEQAGFRNGEECVGHICALEEILKRRKLSEKKTFIAFVDFRKAYDMVPHEAMLRKLQAIGVTGKCLEFIRAQYLDASLKVSVPAGLSSDVAIEVGVRQGSPDSPLLFDIFINDILAKCRQWGVRVLGVKGRMSGLMFADDLALLAGSKRRLAKMVKAVETWALQWGMRFGVKKCGVTVVTCKGEASRTRNFEKLREAGLAVQGEMIPVVEEYRYLGIVINDQLSSETTIADRVSRARKALFGCSAFLSKRTIPLQFRIRVLRALVESVANYGGELFGMSSARVGGLQAVVTQGLRLVSGCRMTSKVCAAEVLQREFGIPPVAATMAGARARAVKRFAKAKTSIARLINNCSFRAAKQTWVTGTQRWLKRWGPKPALPENLSPKGVARIVRGIAWSRSWARSIRSTKSAAAYEKAHFEATRGFLKVAELCPEVAVGVQDLMKMRVGAFWTGEKAAKSRIISSSFRKKCLVCGKGVAEDLVHILCECNAFKSHRTEFLKPLWRRVLGGKVKCWKGLSGRALLEAKVILALGGKVCGRSVKNWTVAAQETEETQMVDGAIPLAPEFIQVAKFLQEIGSLRRPLFSAQISYEPTPKTGVRQPSATGGNHRTTT